MTTVGLAAWCILYALVLSGFQEARSQSVLYGDFRNLLIHQTAPLGGVISPGTPVALISAPRAGLKNTVIVEGTTSGDLRSGPGHRRDTVLPGQPGASLIYGRSLTFGHPFANIGNLRPGDPLTFTTSEGVFKYRVQAVRHAGSPLPAALTGSQSRVTLETSTGSGTDAVLAPDRALYVDAVLTSKPGGGVAGRVSSVPSSEKAMHIDTGSLTVLVLWLQGLVIAVLAFAWSWVRWGSRPTWLLGAPIVLAALWGTTAAAAQLFPNLV